MSGERNPFIGLFTPSADQSGFVNSQGTSANNDNNIITSNSLGNDNKSPAIIDDDEAIKEKEKLEINQIVEEVFHLTLNKESHSHKNGTLNQLVYLADLAKALAPQDWIDVETLEQALFERLLLDDPSRHLLGQVSKDNNSHATQKQVMCYLFECHRRLYLIRSNMRNTIKNDMVFKMMGFVLRNAATALKQPELFESQQLHSQILQIFMDENNSPNELNAFFSGIAQEFVQDDGEIRAELTLTNAFCPTLNALHREMARGNLITLNRAYFGLLHIFACNSQLAMVLLAHSTPKDQRLGKSFSDTLLGSIICLSCLPKIQDGPHEFFDKPLLQSANAVEGNIWTATETIVDNMYRIFHSLLKCSPEVRHRTLRWLGECLQANAARGKMWNSHGLNSGSGGGNYVSDGFMLNLGSMLLKLCQPFCTDLKDPKLLRIDPTYCSVIVKSDSEARTRGVHMKDMASETCLIPVAEGSERPTSESYGFVSECFFMAQRAMDLGFRVALERLMRLNQELARIQRAYNDAQNQGGARNELVQVIGDRLEMEMTRYLSLRAALLEPRSLSMMAQLHVATAVWIVQVALDLDEVPRKSYMPSKFRTVTFPMPEQVPPTLSCVPEFLMENTACFLSFIRRFSPRTLEEQGFTLLETLLTEVLAFMGSPQRMRNPHLRARMAECLESLLPNHNDEQPALNPNPLGFFYRERLFKEHPHRDQIVVNLLDVFVGIEMTGQSVAFEQKFNYRRPMYIVMDYLWNIDEHQECFKRLAADAESNMEAVTPPLFLRFVNLLMNDAVFLLDEALYNMAQLRQMQTSRESGQWQQLSAHEREHNENYFQHIGMIARFDNILGRETIHTLEFLSSQITSIFSHPTMVERIAAMLNYFLFHLVGPNKKNFKVKDQKEYEFNPANIVMDICKIYVHLYNSDSFCLAVSQDGRSYTPELFTYTEDVLARIGGGGLIGDVQAVAAKVAQMKSHQQSEEEILSEPPDEFLDPIMLTLMVDPVILPSSRATVDRSTIARHLLSDQTDPFNRSPLTMDLVKPNDELRNQIEAWIREKRQQRANSSGVQGNGSGPSA